MKIDVENSICTEFLLSLASVFTLFESTTSLLPKIKDFDAKNEKQRRL